MSPWGGRTRLPPESPLPRLGLGLGLQDATFPRSAWAPGDASTDISPGSRPGPWALLWLSADRSERQEGCRSLPPLPPLLAGPGSSSSMSPMYISRQHFFSVQRREGQSV